MIFLDPTSDTILKKIQDLLGILEKNKAELEAYDRYLDDIRSYKGQLEFALDQKAIEIAKKLLQINVLDVQTIAQTTGLTVEQIEELKKNNL